MSTSPTVRRRVASTTLGLTALTALTGLTACSGGSVPMAAAAPPAVTMTGTASTTSTTSPATGPASGVSSASPSPSSAAGRHTPAPANAPTPAGATTGGQTVQAGAAQLASGLPTCEPTQMSVRVEALPGGGAAGSQVLILRATNTGSAQCVTQGYPGVSLVAPGTGRQLGAAAARVPGTSGTPGKLIRLEPGKSAVTQVRVVRAENYGPSCALTQAAGFRVYLPGTTAAAYVPYTVSACTPTSVDQLQVQPFTD